MALYDLLYLDEPWLRSLASQREGDLQRRTLQLSSNEGGGKQVPGNGHAIWTGNGSGTSETTELSVLDDRFARFLKVAGSSIVTLNQTNVSEKGPLALTDGSLVRATGSFFFDDFRAIKKLLHDTASFLDIWAKFKGKPIRAAAESIEHIKTDSREERKARDQKAAEIKMQAARAEAENKASTGQYNLLAELTGTFFGEVVECGVILGAAPANSHLVRAFLDPAHLRPNASFVFERYGARTRANFTIIGTVCRIGWLEDLYLSEAEASGAASMMGSSIASSSPEPRTAFRQAHTMWLQLRRTMMAGSDELSVFLSPIAVLRDLPLEDAVADAKATA